MIIIGDIEVEEMLNQCSHNGRAEIVVIASEEVNGDTVLEDSVAEPSTCRRVNLQSRSDVDHVTNDEVQYENSATICVGSRFHNSNHFKQVLRTEAIVGNYGIIISASDKKRVIAVCSYKGCPWRVRASLCEDGETFEVRRLNGSHSCPGVNRGGNRQASTEWVAHEIQETVKKYPDIPPKQININLEQSYGLSLPYMKLWRSREQAREIIYGAIEDNYKWVPTLRQVLLIRNPGSHITYDCDVLDNSFKRFFVSFKASIDGFLAGCRYLVGLDACHLKSKYLGMLLSANALDGNNGLFTVAFAVVETESKSTWTWFLQNLLQAFGFELHLLAFISDMEKGLGEAIRNIFPNAEHRVCVRHLWKNMKKQFRYQEGHKVQNLFWAASNAYTTSEFDIKVAEINSLNPRVYSYLMTLPYKWSRSQFSAEFKSNTCTNNMSESFNPWITNARAKPAVDLVDTIRGMLMDQRVKRKMHSSNWNGELVPHAEAYIRDVTTRREQFIIRHATMFRAELEGCHVRHEVDIQNHECTCRFWQVSGLPCIHAVSFICNLQHPLWHTYISEHYYVSRYKVAYNKPISTMPGKESWNFVHDENQVRIPNTSRPRGRPRKKRLRSFLEDSSNVTRSKHKCSRCGLAGHHKSSCKNPLSQGDQTTPPNCP